MVGQHSFRLLEINAAVIQQELSIPLSYDSTVLPLLVFNGGLTGVWG